MCTILKHSRIVSHTLIIFGHFQKDEKGKNKFILEKQNVFAVTPYRNDSRALFMHLCSLRDDNIFQIGFNSIFFDYPILHYFMNMYYGGVSDPEIIREQIHYKANDIIQNAERFHSVRKPLINQLDLFKINHYDNPAKRTSLKLLEFNMRMDNIMELPYAPDADLAQSEIDELIAYNTHDVEATKRFADKCAVALEFRFGLVEKFGKKVLNYSDSKIGSEYMINELIDKMGYDRLYKIQNGKRVPIQTYYEDGFYVKDLLFDYIKFERPETQALLDFFKTLKLEGTKGMFAELTLDDVGDLAEHIEHDLGATNQKKLNTREYLDLGEFEKTKKGYPILPKTDSYKGMTKYAERYHDFLNSDNESYVGKYGPFMKDGTASIDEHKLPRKIKKLNLKLRKYHRLLGYWWITRFS